MEVFRSFEADRELQPIIFQKLPFRLVSVIEDLNTL